MQYELTETHAHITCTFDELSTMDSLSQVIYATPTPQGKAMSLYVASYPQWRDDFIIATVADFCAAEGWTTLGWEEMAEHDRDTVANDETTIEVSLHPQDREGKMYFGQGYIQGEGCFLVDGDSAPHRVASRYAFEPREGEIHTITALEAGVWIGGRPGHHHGATPFYLEPGHSVRAQKIKQGTTFSSEPSMTCWEVS